MKRLLTLDDLYDYYSKRKNSYHYDSEKTGNQIIVQTEGILKFEQNEEIEGLTPVSLQACHTDQNRNKSFISKEVMENKFLPSFKNRPILGYLHQVKVNNSNENNTQDEYEWNFKGHEMHLDEENDEIIYDEIAVGIIPETNNARLKYNKEENHYDVFVDGYIFNEYTKAQEVLEREKECYVSVELSLREFSYNAKEKYLEILDGYVSGVTILGKNENGELIQPGMKGSNIKLKDFSEENNSLFSSIDSSIENEITNKLIEQLEKLNNNLSNININSDDNSDTLFRKEDKSLETENKNEVTTEVNEENENVEINEEATVVDTESTEEVVETPEVVETEACGDKKEDESCGDKKEDESCENRKEKCDEDDSESAEESEDEEGISAQSDEDDLEENTEENVIDDGDAKGKKSYSKTFEISHEDIRCSLYNLLVGYEESMNDYFWIVEVYDDHFVFQGMTGKYYGHKYSKNEDSVALEGQIYSLYPEFLTSEEKNQLDDIRSSYESIKAELNSYHEAEEFADKMNVFTASDYAEYLDTDEFKSLMEKENVMKYSKDELSEKADAALGKIVRRTKTFSYEKHEEVKKPSMFAFAKRDEECSFLDGLLNK